MDKRFLEYLKCINSQVHLFSKNEKKKKKTHEKTFCQFGSNLLSCLVFLFTDFMCLENLNFPPSKLCNHSCH